MGVQFGDGGPVLAVEMALEDSTGTPYKDVVAIDGPAVWYRLGDAVGSGTAVDESGNGFDATVHGGVAFGANGLVAGDDDTAATFNGTTGYLQAAASADYMPTTALTLSAMVKLAAPSIGAYIVTFGNFALQVLTAGGPVAAYEFKDAAGHTGILVAPVALTVGTSTWIVATDDGTTVRMYVDGVKVAEKWRYELGTGLGIPGSGFDPTLSFLYVGGPAGALVHGIVDEVAVWKDVALTPAEIARQAAARAQIVEPAWTDMTDRLDSCWWSRGAQYESADPTPGQADFMLYNRDGALTPSNAASPWYPFVDTEREIRATATYSGVTYPLFRGETTGPFKLTWDLGDPCIDIPAADALAALSLAKFSDSLYAGWYGSRINQILDIVYWRRDRRAVDAGNSRGGYHAAITNGLVADASTEIANAVRSEQGRCFVDGDAAVTFHERYRQWRNRTVYAVFGDQPGEIPYRSPAPEYSNQRLVNQSLVNREGGTATIIVDNLDAQGRRRIRSESVATNLETDDDCETLGEYRVTRYQNPDERLESIVIDAVAVNEWPVVLGVEIGKRVQVRDVPPPEDGDAAVGVLRDYFVEGFKHEPGPKANWTLTLQLSPAYDVTRADIDPESAGLPVGY